MSLSGLLGFGTTNVILGRDGWLFYRPGIELLTGSGLLDPGRLAVAKRELIEAGEANPSPDPRPAILAFQEDCRKAGVHLVIMPVPDKTMLQPAELSARAKRRAPSGVPANVDYARMLDQLRSAGVDVFDPSPKKLIPGETTALSPPRFALDAGLDGRCVPRTDGASQVECSLAANTSAFMVGRAAASKPTW